MYGLVLQLFYRAYAHNSLRLLIKFTAHSTVLEDKDDSERTARVMKEFNMTGDKLTLMSLCTWLMLELTYIKCVLFPKHC